MKKILLIFTMLFTTIAFSQTKTFNTKVKMNNTPNLAVVDSILIKDSSQVLRTTSFADLASQLGIIPSADYLENVVEDLTPELGGNLVLNNFDITGTGDINHSGNITSTGTLQIPNIDLTNDLTLNNYLNTRDDGVSINYLFTDASGNLQSGPVGNLGAEYIDDLFDAIYDNSSLYLGNGSGIVSTGGTNLGAGISALASITSGNDNTALGAYTIPNITTALQNTAVGSRAMNSLISAGANVGVGFKSLFLNTASFYNTALGSESGYSTTGTRGVFIGYQAGYNETTGNKLYIDSSNTTAPLIYGEFDNNKLIFNAAADLAQLSVQPTGTVDLAIATTKYVDDSSGALTAYKTADQTKTSDTTLVIDTDLQVELESGGIYSVKIELFSNFDATPDARIGFQTPTGASGGYTTDLDSTSATASLWTDTTQYFGTGLDALSHFFGNIVVTNAGTFGVKWAQNTSGVESTTLKKGSWIELIKLN